LIKPSPILPSLLLLALAVPAAGAQQAGSAASSAAELIEREKLRSTVEQALATYTQPVESGAVEVDNFVKAAEQLVMAGPGVAPYIINELEQAIPNTFFLCAYSLGLLGTAESETALHKAIEQAEGENGRYPLYRKAWAALALAMMGRADAIDLLNGGKHKAGIVPVHARWAALETIAVHTYPQSLPRLLKMLDEYAGDEDMRNQRVLVLKALWHIADPSTLPELLEVMKESDPKMRSQAARVLGAIDSPEAVSAAMAALGDSDGIVRRSAAWSLLHSGAPVDLERIMERLEVEDDAAARGSLYEIAARVGGSALVEDLTKHWGRPDGSDRAGLLQALGLIGSDDALPTIREGLFDEDGRVILFATEALGAIGSEAAVDLLIEAVRSRNFITAQEAVKVLRELGESRAAPVIAERLLKVEMVGALRDARFRSRVELLADTLVDLRYHQVLEELLEQKELQTDSQLLIYLDGVIGRMEALKQNGRKAKRWIAALESAEPEIRQLAYERLGEIGGAPAARALAGHFGRVGQREGMAILDALGKLNEEPSLDLIERILTGPEFDSVERAGLRSMAAWSARRLGGDRMIEALKASAARRHGRDVHVLIYLALLEGESVLSTLAEYRMLRMKYVGWLSGKELEKLDWIARHIRDGGSLSAVDVPPHEISFN
jgi:HEAT repeat protein